MTTDELVHQAAIEAADLVMRHGSMPPTVEAVYFHTARAYQSLATALLAKQPDGAHQSDRLIHLAAVCIRAAEALSRQEVVVRNEGEEQS